MWVHCRNKRSWNRQPGICYWGSFASWNPLSRTLPWHLWCEILPHYTWEVCHTCYMWRWRHSQESVHGTNITCRRCQESLCWRTWTATWGCCFRYGHIAFSSKCLLKGVNIAIPWLFIPPAMFCLELEWMVGERGKEEPQPFLYFLLTDRHPLCKISFLPPAILCFKNQRW